MRILLIAWYFPPTNTIAAVRLGKLAKFLTDAGHEVRVVSARDLPFSMTLPLQIPRNQVEYTRWADVNALPGYLLRRFGRRSGSGGRAAANYGPPGTPVRAGRSTRAWGRLRAWLSDTYRYLFNCPDSQIGWLPYALRAGRSLVESWRPQVVLASGPPFTTLIAGQRLARFFGVPWVAELRDRWSDDPYYPPPAWRRALNRALERHVLGSAAALVTVSEPWAETYRERYRKPTAVIYNGFDDDVPSPGEGGPAPESSALRIVYTGGIYPGRRDPAPLFRAIALLGEESRSVKVEFYGTDESLVAPIARGCGVERNVTVYPEVTHEEAVRVQRGADVLLLMQWNDAKEQGNVPGKFFEYLGARRPILVLGLEDGVPASIVRARGAGVYGGSPEEIAEQLRAWLQVKREHGAIPALPEAARAGFARREQYRNLETFLDAVLAGRLGAPRGAGGTGARAGEPPVASLSRPLDDREAS